MHFQKRISGYFYRTTRDGLYNEYSDVDVVIAYEGTVSEDDLFSALNEAGYKVGNMRVDI